MQPSGRGASFSRGEHRRNNVLIELLTYERNAGGEPWKITLNDLASGSWNAGDTVAMGYVSGLRLGSEDWSSGTDIAYTYDAAGNRRTQRTLPLAASETFGYDKASRPLTHTNFNALITTNQYDAMGRLWKVWNGSTLLETRSYSALGQLTSRVDASGTHTWVYDALGRLKTNSTPAGTLYYTYDRAGNLLTLGSTTSNGVTNSYTYDDLNRLTTLTDNRLSKSTLYAYDGVGNLASVTYPTTSYTVVGRYLYDSLNRLTNLVWSCNGAVRAGFGYTLGPAGNRLTLAETNNGTERNYTWGYDNAYRLTSEQLASTVAPTGTVTYGYDDAGNRTSRTAALGLTAQTVNFDQRDQIDNDAVATTASAYFNANGNTLTYGGTYTYDWANRLLTQASPSVTLTYDGDGNRIKKVAGGITTWYLVATVNPSGYPQVGEELTGTTPPTLSRVYSYGLDLACQRTISGSVVRYFGYDGLGSTKFLLDPAGAVTDTYTYDAYGTRIASTGSTANNYRYAGEQWDADLGMYYLRARYLNPNLGRFQTRDTFEGSISDPLSLHRYLYGEANPASKTDPSGNMAIAEMPVIGGWFGGRASYETARAPTYSSALVRAKTLAEIAGSITIGYLAGEIVVERTGVREWIDRAKEIWKNTNRNVKMPKIVPMPTTAIPTVAAHIATHQTGNPGSMLLTRAPIGRNIINRSRVMLGRGSAPSGMSWDEYPFASSMEGGNLSTVSVVPVPKKENLVQGGIIFGSYVIENIQPGDKFAVIVVP